MQEGANNHCIFSGANLARWFLLTPNGHESPSLIFQSYYSLFKKTAAGPGIRLIFWINSCVLQLVASWVCARRHRLLRAGQHLKTLNWQRQSEIGAAGRGEWGAAEVPLLALTAVFTDTPLILFTNKTWYPGSFVALRQNPNNPVLTDKIWNLASAERE